MRKDNYHDYAAEAFRYYALCGKPAPERLRRLRTTAPSGRRGALGDLEAVGRVVDRLENMPDGERELVCLDRIYFAHPRSTPGRGVMTERAQSTALELNISLANVYRTMHTLRHLFAVERGLRITDDSSQWME